jgi:hypothetical protein
MMKRLLWMQIGREQTGEMSRLANEPAFAGNNHLPC